MTINSDLLKNYSDCNINQLSHKVIDTTTRIQFEQWLVHHCPDENSSTSQFMWFSKIIERLCFRARTASSTFEEKKQEDLLIAHLICKAMPLSPTEKTPHHPTPFETLTEICRFLYKRVPFSSKKEEKSLSATEKVNAFSSTFTELLRDPDLSFSRYALLKRMLKQRDFYEIFTFAMCSNNYSMIEMLSILEPKKFAKVVIDQEALLFSIDDKDSKLAKIIAHAVPESIQRTTDKGNTALHLAIKDGLKELAKSLAEIDPKAITKKNASGNTPLHLAVIKNQVDLAASMIELNVETLPIQNNNGFSALQITKAIRPENYKEITHLYKKHNPSAVATQKAITSRLAVSHGWHIDGMTTLVERGSKKSIASFSLEGHYTNEWWHLMKKNLQSFESAFPSQLRDHLPLMEALFDRAENSYKYSTEDILTRIKAGQPTTIDLDFSGHGISLFFWGNHFVICNRGYGMRQTVEFYHYNKNLIDAPLLQEMEKIKTLEDYEKLLYKELPQKLQCVSSDLDIILGDSCPLPAQTVGNCSLVNSITAVYAFIIIGIIWGINRDGTLQHNKELLPYIRNSIKQHVDEAIAVYQKWITNLQVYILEKHIQLLVEQKNLFEPDHNLIKKAFCKAYSLPLALTFYQRFEHVRTSYRDLLDPIQQTSFDIECVDWKNASRAALL